MSQIFHRSTNTVARVSIFGAVFFIAGLLGLFEAVDRSPWVTQAGVAREQPIQFSHERHVAGNGIDCLPWAAGSFTSRVAIPNSRSYYEINLAFPQSRRCTTGGTGGPTNTDIRAGQRVVQRMFVPYGCHGLVHGTVVYVPTVGPASSMPVPGLQGQTGSIPVGRFSFVVP